MNRKNQELTDFLRRHKLYTPDIDMEKELQRLLNEMMSQRDVASDSFLSQKQRPF